VLAIQDLLLPARGAKSPPNIGLRSLGCGNSIPYNVFPISKTCWALIGVLKTSRDTKKDCGEPGCLNDHPSQVLARGDEADK
jgi:hypothetical protein